MDPATSVAGKQGPEISVRAFPPPSSTGVPLSERFQAVKNEAAAAAAKKPQILAGGFGYGTSGFGVGIPMQSTSAGAAAAANYSMMNMMGMEMGGSCGQFHNNINNTGFPVQFQRPRPQMAAAAAARPSSSSAASAAMLRNNIMFTKMLAAKVAAAQLNKNQFVNGSVMGRPNANQIFQAKKAPVLARVGAPKNIVKKKYSGGGMNCVTHFKSLGSKLVIDKGTVGGGCRGGRGRGRGGRGRGAANNSNNLADKWSRGAQSKETLDKELDSYMAATRNKKKGKGDLDEELEQYMRDAAKARAQLNALSVSGESETISSTTDTAGGTD